MNEFHLRMGPLVKHYSAYSINENDFKGIIVRLPISVLICILLFCFFGLNQYWNITYISILYISSGVDGIDEELFHSNFFSSRLLAHPFLIVASLSFPSQYC